MKSKLLALAAFAAILGVPALADSSDATSASSGGSMDVSVVDAANHVAGEPWTICVTAGDDLTGAPVVITADAETVAVVTLEPGANYIQVPDADEFAASFPSLPGAN